MNNITVIGLKKTIDIVVKIPNDFIYNVGDGKIKGVSVY